LVQIQLANQNSPSPRLFYLLRPYTEDRFLTTHFKVELNALSDLPLALARVYTVVLTRNLVQLQIWPLG